DSAGSGERAVHLVRKPVLGSHDLGGRRQHLIDVSRIDGQGIARGLRLQERVEVRLIGKSFACRPGDPGSQRLSGFDGIPFRVGNDTDKVVDLYYLRVSGQSLDDVTVDVLDLGAQSGRPDDFAVKHAGDTNFLHILVRALGFGRHL